MIDEIINLSWSKFGSINPDKESDLKIGTAPN